MAIAYIEDPDDFCRQCRGTGRDSENGPCFNCDGRGTRCIVLSDPKPKPKPKGQIDE